MKPVLLCLFLLSWGRAVCGAQASTDSVVRCAPDSLLSDFRELMSELQFNQDSSGVGFVPNSGSSDLGTKAHIIRDPATCRRAHEAYVRYAVESEQHPDRVAVARAGKFYFIYEYDSGLALVDRNWKYVAVFGWGL